MFTSARYIDGLAGCAVRSAVQLQCHDVSSTVTLICIDMIDNHNMRGRGYGIA